MPTFKKVSNAKWVNWEDLVERVRSAKTTEVAVARLQKELDMVLRLREGSSAREAVEDYNCTAVSRMAWCGFRICQRPWPTGTARHPTSLSN